ncbi:ABC transporter permease [Zavarzinella formosa]|uniref:ABC transporter permease n=1 Tax=Zavarzinella formosa TaxID=360055 RepID=UPI00031D68E6|nr:ABC transporter permease [Zavarzinella formosa]
MRAARSTVTFYLGLGSIGVFYVGLILAMLAADLFFTTPDHLLGALQTREIQYAIRLSLVSCFVTTLLSLWVAVPLGYLLARTQFPGKAIVDTILDIPIVLPPLVLGLSLLILFQMPPGKWIEHQTTHHMGKMLVLGVFPLFASVVAWLFARRHVPYWAILSGVAVATSLLMVTGTLDRPIHWSQTNFGTGITYAIPSVILAQFSVSAAFAVRTMRVTFDQISPRTEQVALTLGCTRAQAFWLVAIPESWRGLVTAATIAWARALGEFGPILIFSGATRMRTEVLSTTVFLELSVGRLEGAIAVSLLMVIVAVFALLLMRTFGLRGGSV